MYKWFPKNTENGQYSENNRPYSENALHKLLIETHR